MMPHTPSPSTDANAGLTPPPDLRQGDISAFLRVMGPLYAGTGVTPVESNRRMVADLFRFFGRRFGATVGGGPAGPSPLADGPPPRGPEVSSAPPDGDLTPRAAETLRHLLAGDSEKEVARRMHLSPHTVHGHVKALYRRFGVSTRAELLAHHLRRDGDRQAP